MALGQRRVRSGCRSFLGPLRWRNVLLDAGGQDMTERPLFVLGLDLDGTCADFYARMREIASEWTGQPLESLPVEPQWGLGNWGIGMDNYARFHRFAVTQRGLFETMKPIADAPQAIRRLGMERIRIRIITHRLIIRYF